MTERQLQFRVGLFVITALLIALGLGVTFGSMKSLFQRNYSLNVHFDEAPGVEAMTPVRKNGVAIGEVREVFFDPVRGGVSVVLDIEERYPLRRDSRARLAQSLLGDASIEFSPGQDAEHLQPGDFIEGEPPFDAMALLKKMEGTLSQTMSSFEATSEEWRKVGHNVNSLVQTNRGDLEVVIERAAESLHQFTQTMKNANAIVGNPANQQNLEKTIAALPKMVEETHQTIRSVRLTVNRVSGAMDKADQNLENLIGVTEPLAEKSDAIVTKLHSSVHNLDALLLELNQFARTINSEDGTLNKLVSDPELYRNLNHTAASMTILMQNLQPAIRDLRIFTDKVARHPELIGVGGAFKSSSGLK